MNRRIWLYLSTVVAFLVFGCGTKVMVPPEELIQRSSHDAVRAWLDSLPMDALVDVVKTSQSEYTHGLQNRTSNRALPPETVERFISFVLANSAPNGRKSTYRGKTHWLRPDIRLIEAPRKPPSLDALLGLDESRRYAQTLVHDAMDALTSFDNNSMPLKAIAQYILDRNR